MLSIRKVLCVSLLHYFVCGNIIKNQPPNYHRILGTKPAQKIPSSTPPSKECEPGKSLNSRNDIKVMIDFIYNETSADKLVKQNYQSNAEAIRNKHLQDLNGFTAWFENQPEHLKDLLQTLETIRKMQVEPAVKMVTDELSEYPKLEMSYNKQNDQANKLFDKFNRYSNICKLKCEDKQVKEHNIAKRQVPDGYYCSSLEDLHKEITEKLNKSVEKLNSWTLNSLSLGDKKYEEKIDEIKSKLKDSALKEFGRTMYDILSLEYEYHSFMDSITSIDLHEAIYDIKSLKLEVDEKLLVLEEAIEEYGEHCNSCDSKILIRNPRKANLGSEAKMAPNLVDELIEIKYNEITTETLNDFKNIFNDLDVLIQKIDEENISIDKLKPIQEEINKMTNNEKDALSKLKKDESKLVILILQLIKKLKELVKLIIKIIHCIFPK
ncbi:uncharacterized protein LOC123868063 [Maniola jurtina]|uniref:uncharacterized protein LOC123868063 n=1 Tax=Maniola jurtina TaxID=191418 RepID=UPI001E68CCF0|nr:uncharacterized protein LOC123868063 [Maniola jurtina]